MSARTMAADIPEQPENGYGLTVDQVSFERGGRTFGPLSIRVREGQIIGLLGPDGAGKTSLLRVIEGVSKPSAGVIRACGSDITALSRSGRQNIGLFVCLHDSRRFRANRSMLEIVTGAVSRNPKVLLLDEPFGMLDSLTRMELQQTLIELWRRDKKTALMVTHDVDEALFLSDRIVMMTNGPEAEVGDILKVTFPRPRERKAVLEHPDYYKLREHLIEFLEFRAHKKRAFAQSAPSDGRSDFPLVSDSQTQKVPVSVLSD